MHRRLKCEVIFSRDSRCRFLFFTKTLVVKKDDLISIDIFKPPVIRTTFRALKLDLADIEEKRMIKMIDIGVEKAVAYRISGKITDDDMALAISAIKNKVDSQGEVFLYQEIESIGGVELEAIEFPKNT